MCLPLPLTAFEGGFVASMRLRLLAGRVDDAVNTQFYVRFAFTA